jgi:hypothetical protein
LQQAVTIGTCSAVRLIIGSMRVEARCSMLGPTDSPV